MKKWCLPARLLDSTPFVWDPLRVASIHTKALYIGKLSLPADVIQFS